MIFNCLGCGVSVSTNRVTCPYCKANNAEFIEIFTGVAKSKTEKMPTEWRERVKGSILTLVHR